MSNEKKVSDILNRLNYKFRDMTKRDLLNALGQFKDLQPLSEFYVFPTGQTCELLTLTGTVPVSYKSGKYNIPIQIYLMDSHPYNAPICYVRPTSDMSINVSSTVDSSGRISLPELQDWRFPTSELYLLINILIIKFSENTPLYAKTNRSAGGFNYPSSTASAVVRNPLPYPSSTGGTASLPPYPSSNSMTSMPPYPVTPSMPGSNMPFSYPYPSYPQQTPPVKPPPPQPPQQQQPRYPSSLAGTVPLSGYSDETLKPEYILLSLKSAAGEKIHARFNDYQDQLRAEIDVSNKTHHELNVNSQRLDDVARGLQSEIDNLKRYTSELQSKCQALSVNFDRKKHRNNADIDDAVVAAAPIYRQIMNLFAEELALQDFMFYLNEGLLNKSVPLELYLKQMRMCSRKQFMVRALILKCRETAGLH